MGAAHYLRLLDKDGQLIEGESEGPDFEECIDVTSWNWGVTDESVKKAAAPKDVTGKGTAAGPAKGSAGGGEVGVVPMVFTFNKSVDASTTRLMQEMYCGNVLQKATFTLLEERIYDNRDRIDVFRLNVVLEDVRVASYGLDVRASEHRVDMEETWGLDYTTIRFDYVTAGGMNATFDMPAGAEKVVSERPNAQLLETLKKLGYPPPDSQGKVPGKRG